MDHTGELSFRLMDAIASEMDYSERLINLGLPLQRRVLILGAVANGELPLGAVDASTALEMIGRIGALVTGAMMNSAAREFVLTETNPNGTFATYGISRTAHAGFVASQFAPFDETTVQTFRWPDAHVRVLRSWIPEIPTRLTNAPPEIWQAMSDVAPGGEFEVRQMGPRVSGFSAECGHA